MNAENTAAVIGLPASIAVNYAGRWADTIGGECHEWMAASATPASTSDSPGLKSILARSPLASSPPSSSG
jgi:hypothetical protein